MDWNIGDTILGKYCVERVLGQGGMGIVVAARHNELGELHAIKMMHTHTARTDDSAGRFLREARASARLQGEHVARVYDVGRSEDGTLFMVMEHLDGVDLKTHLAQHGRLSPHEAVKLVLQACDGISEAHEMGIVHRDIKPANLFLVRKRKTNDEIVKVLDFGISKEMNSVHGTDLTQSGTMLGSPLYMSPEQMVQARDVDTRTDIWSLGVVLYELISGKPPFLGETMAQVVNSVMNLEPKPICTHVPEVPHALDLAIARCLKKDPAHRFGTVEALAEALQSVLTNKTPADAAVDVTVKEKKAALPGADALGDTAAAIAIDSTVATPAPAANRNVSALALSATEAIVKVATVEVPKTTAPLSTTLPSVTPAANAETTTPSPKRTNLFVVAAMALVFIGIVAYVVTMSRHVPETPTHEDANNVQPITMASPALDSNVSTAIAPTSTIALPAISPAMSAAPSDPPSIAKSVAVKPSPAKPTVGDRGALLSPSASPALTSPIASPSATTETKSPHWGQGPL